MLLNMITVGKFSMYKDFQENETMPFLHGTFQFHSSLLILLFCKYGIFIRGETWSSLLLLQSHNIFDTF